MRFLLIATALLGAAPARAQLIDANREFVANPFRPGVGKEAILNVDAGTIPGHLQWDLALWLGFADDPIVFNEKPAGSPPKRVVSLLKGQFHGHIQGAIALFGWGQLGIDVPTAFHQWRNDRATDRFGLDQVSSLGLGDIGLSPKLALLRRDRALVDLALIARVTLPTSVPKNQFLGERFVAAEPALAVSMPLFDDQLEIAGNVAARLRRATTNANHLRTRIDSEVLLRFGAAYTLKQRFDVPVTAKVALEQFTSAKRPTSRETEGGAELVFGCDYAISDDVTLLGGAGLPMDAGYSIPDYRVFVGIHVAKRRHDRDGDGIGDDVDACPDVQEDQDGFEDVDGCPDPDNDRDGVLDVKDGAPLDPEDPDGFEDADGVPDPDNDKDEILDDVDGAPMLPEDKDGFEDDDGIPDPDNDGDGLADDQEKCPGQFEDYDGFEDEDGCTDPDNDQDSVLDVVDAAPMLPEDKDGFEDEDGAPEPDNDQDGFLDGSDQCPIFAEVINGQEDDDGCPDVGESKAIVTATKIEILEKVYFDTAKSTIQARSIDLLRQVAAILKANPQIQKLRIEGHTDDRGADAANLTLSQSRADAVLTFITEAGVERERLLAVGFGETMPIASNQTTRGRESNRRVEFVIVGPEEAQEEAKP